MCSISAFSVLFLHNTRMPLWSFDQLPTKKDLVRTVYTVCAGGIIYLPTCSWIQPLAEYLARRAARRKRPGSPPAPTYASCTRQHKDRHPNCNWSTVPKRARSALIGAIKEGIFHGRIGCCRSMDEMQFKKLSGFCVSQHEMQAGHSPCMRAGPTCKAKWDQMRSCMQLIRKENPWLLRAVYIQLSMHIDRWRPGLPKTFTEDLALWRTSGMVNDHKSSRSMHVRDLGAVNDGNPPGVLTCIVSHKQIIYQW